MTAKQIRAIRHKLGLTCVTFALVTGVTSERTVRRWESGEWAIPGYISGLLELLLATSGRARKAFIAKRLDSR